MTRPEDLEKTEKEVGEIMESAKRDEGIMRMADEIKDLINNELDLTKRNEQIAKCVARILELLN